MYRNRIRNLRFMGALVLATTGVVAQAQLSPSYGTYGAPMSSFLASSFLAQQAANNVMMDSGGKSSSKAKPPPAPAQPLTFRESGTPIAPAKMASSYPEASRAQAQRMFENTLAAYHKIEQKAGLPRNDMGGALATFVAGNYFTWRDQTVPDDAFKALVSQMNASLSRVPELRNASDAEKQELYEQLAITGMFVMLTREGLQQRPDPQHATQMKQAAKGYLEQFFKVGPERMQIDSRGLVMR
jgi:hypothetical protein